MSIIEKVAEWYATPVIERKPITQAELAEKLGVTPQLISHYLRKLREPAADKDVKKFNKRLFELATKPNATAKHMELYAKLKGLLVERSESKVLHLTADDIARIHNDNRQFLQGYTGVQSVQTELPVLPEIREDTGPSEGDDTV